MQSTPGVITASYCLKYGEAINETWSGVSVSCLFGKNSNTQKGKVYLFI